MKVSDFTKPVLCFELPFFEADKNMVAAILIVMT